MDCTRCKNKICRKGERCEVVSFDTKELVDTYWHEQQIIKAASELVDNGRAGTLSRLQEIAEFSELMNYKTIGLAYCYGMENDAAMVAKFLREKGFHVVATSCTVGGIAQNLINPASSFCSVSCNPVGQARQLNSHNPDLVVSMGLCLGHDILFSREIKSDATTLVVKDRVYNHEPLKALNELKK